MSNDGSGNLKVVDNKPTIHDQEWDLLNKIAQSSLDSSDQLIEQLFSAADDLFYELSERASTNNEENLYFEAMREIRVKKQNLTDSFIDGVVDNFKRIPEMCLKANRDVDSDDDSELSIVDREQLEIDLAKSNMATRTRDSYKTELYELSMRMNALLSECPVNEESNPLDPIQLSTAFVDASTRLLALDIKTRLILFKLFEKHYLKQLGHIFADANQILIDAGYLPKVPKKHLADGDEEQAQDSAEKTAIEKQEENPGFEKFDTGHGQPFQLETAALASLMASIRSAQQANLPGIQALGNYHFFSSNPGPVMRSPELTDILTDSQRNVEEKISTEAPQNLVPQVVTDILSLKNPEEPQALAQPDEDVINLVALFFDKVLEDDNLPLAVQSLICRLQIPMLKVALHDKTFLTNDRHPARLLINAITEAGLTFDDSKPLERDPVYRIITEGVHTINHQFKLDDKVFTEVAIQINDALEAEKQKSSVVENRTQQSESGKAKLRAAKTFAQQALYDKLKDVELPQKISEFLTATWLQVMIITFIRSGKEGETWVENEQLISDLIWASQPHDDEKSLARRERLLPEIFERIERGLEQVVDNETTRKNKVEEIRSTILSDDAEAQATQHLTEEQISALGKTDPSQKSWEEMTALERQQARYEELSSQFYLEAKHMPENTWLEYQDEEKGKLTRCKLSTKIDSENYVFVNRFGFKVMVKTRRQFAYDMQFKKAKVLDTTPLFERVMDKVVTQIRSITQEL
jgi:hypothetical protein